MARFRAFFALELLALAFTVSTPAFAQSASEPTGEHAESPSGDARSRALELFEQSKAHYDRGEFVAAAALLERAYATFPEPVLLYNLARSQQEAGELQKALDAYERYLEADPEVKDRAGIEQRIMTLREQLRTDRERSQAQASASTSSIRSSSDPARTPMPQPSPNDPAQSGDSKTILPWIVAGAGAATIGAGAVLGLFAKDRHESAKDEPSAMKASDQQEQAEDLAVAANVAFVAGGILTAVGVGWGIVVMTSGEESGTRNSSTLFLGPASARWRLEF